MNKVSPKQPIKSHPLYCTWNNMMNRCRNKNSQDYKYYGGRGIKVCDRWFKFWNFVEDMGERPEKHTLDRIDNDIGYCPENCRWVDRSTQSLNVRSKGKSGIKNISFRNGMCRVRVRWKGKMYQLSLPALEEAVEFRDLLIEELVG